MLDCTLAYGIYEFLEHLSADKELDERIRLIAMHLWDHIAPFENQQTNAIKEIQKRLSFHLRKKMDENMEKLYYPMITRLMINLVGLGENNVNKRFMAQELHDSLRRKIKTAFEIDEEKAKDILPTDVKYLKEANMLLSENKRARTSYEFKL